MCTPMLGNPIDLPVWSAMSAALVVVLTPPRAIPGGHTYSRDMKMQVTAVTGFRKNMRSLFTVERVVSTSTIT